MARKILKPHWVILFDDRDRRFTVRGPVTDDTAITNRVADLQQAGREIRCQAVPQAAYPSRDDLIRRVPEELEGGFVFDDAAFSDVT